METDWKDSHGGGGDGGGGGGSGDDRGQNSNLTNNDWDIWDISTNNAVTLTNHHDSRYYCSNPAATGSVPVPEPSVIHALLFGHVTESGVGWDSVHHGVTDPHMMCLRLGKRHYCEDAVVPDRHVAEVLPSAFKRGKQVQPYSCYNSRGATAVRVTCSTRCQVEGCNVALGGAKEYYRRHKVCEIHSKAPKVVVLGLQQRFCQQCSRFHEVTEFDEAKRSCRRRLKGHNLRRRKGTLSNSLPPNFPHSHENNYMMKQRLRPPSPSPLSSQSKPACALSLLSSSRTNGWISSDDFSSRCSAALYELIVANRATSALGLFLNQNSSHQPVSDDTMHTPHETQMQDRFSHTTMSLDLKQAPALDFGLWSMKDKPKDIEEWTDYCWSNFGGANVV
ncbi:hypothetical protein E3N88_16896 [Mikania micrantha]|uniref:SBP-type domain-containing protein n=1 Tax=Mikania micrantha TaxID=192012 RepID=A0A5N6NRT8_9ASTR|nr:hypothetical protein E3N88_16896 [Mikania micrantha]